MSLSESAYSKVKLEDTHINSPWSYELALDLVDQQRQYNMDYITSENMDMFMACSRPSISFKKINQYVVALTGAHGVMTVQIMRDGINTYIFGQRHVIDPAGAMCRCDFSEAGQ